MVLKFFTPDEQLSFEAEVAANLKVNTASRLQVLMIKFVEFKEKKNPMKLCGQVFDSYAYIILPYCEYGTVLDLLMKANKLGRRISPKLQKYLFRSLLLSLYELMSASGLNHLDIKPDNVVLDENFTCKLIDYGHASPRG